MRTLNANRTGLVFGTVLGGWHAIWAVLVAFGWAQPIMDFVFWIHMIKPAWVISPFSIWLSLILIAVTGAIGYVGGFSAAVVWNWLHRESYKTATQGSEWLPRGESSVR